MEKIVKKNCIPFTFCPDRKGAKYSLDNGKTYKNGGEFSEIIAKGNNGFIATKDGNTPFDKGNDIPEIACSIKSSKATLTSTILGENYAESKQNYFDKTAAKKWWWATFDGEYITVYQMNKQEFADFMDMFAGYEKSRKVIRFKTTSRKMIEWLDSHSV